MWEKLGLGVPGGEWPWERRGSERGNVSVNDAKAQWQRAVQMISDMGEGIDGQWVRLWGYSTGQQIKQSTGEEEEEEKKQKKKKIFRHPKHVLRMTGLIPSFQHTAQKPMTFCQEPDDREKERRRSRSSGLWRLEGAVIWGQVFK